MENDEKLESFIDRFDDFSKWDGKRQVDYIAYFLMAEVGANSVTSKQIQECFDTLSLKPYTRTAVYLSESTSDKNGRYVKSPTGYRLERSVYDDIKRAVNNEPQKIQVSTKLIELIAKIKDSQERAFLEEAIRCYRVEAFRATIVMIWTLTMDHLQKYAFGQYLNEFNAAIAANSDKKMKPVVNYDDFSEFKESRVIELMRSSGIISGDVRKILDEKLGIRNSAGHPSGISFSDHKTTEFALDLIDNVLLKY